MFLRNKRLGLVLVLSVVLLLAACGGSTKDKLVGTWKVVIDGETAGHLEIGEERLINKDESVTAEYIVTESEDGNFLLEVINPEDGTNELLFEGYFENKDKIIVVKSSSGTEEDSQLIRE
ncbi:MULTISPECIES: hypothetical protein [Bacillaceae]|uniref:hypothetical protein n=1 Tax=Bacillaceae TaxID=186817 RepID=UPI001E3BD4BB|nr:MULTISPECIES: hypothetical protein [Bacillaceae]MCE4047947.1 hypothetical protein [Bacillus sp. Au-Bac7]MCM3032478.1 hypothetical protein [Niallia sp. MER 6]